MRLQVGAAGGRAHRVCHAGEQADDLHAIEGREEAAPRMRRLPLPDLAAPLPPPEAGSPVSTRHSIAGVL